jgi:hypothetical protein
MPLHYTPHLRWWSTFKLIKNQQHETKYAILIARTNKSNGAIGGGLYLRHSLASCLFLCLSVTLELAYITLLITRLMSRPAKKKSVDSVTHYLVIYVRSYDLGFCLFRLFGLIWTIWVWRDSNPHFTDFKSVASAVGLHTRGFSPNHPTSNR